MKANKNKVRLPIGGAAKLAFQIDALRMECCEAAELLVKQKQLGEAELDECARLDDALADAHRLLKSTLTSITFSRLKRRSRIR